MPAEPSDGASSRLDASPAPDSQGSAKEVVGRTVWDVLSHSLRHRSGRITAVVMTVIALAALASGWIRISWLDRFNISFARPIAEADAERFAGVWRGEGADVSVPGESTPVYKYALNLTFTPDGQVLRLNGTYDVFPFSGEIANASPTPQRTIRGEGRVRGEFVIINYDVTLATEPGALGYGSLLFQLLPDGTRMQGRFVSRSMKDNALIVGSVTLHR